MKNIFVAAAVLSAGLSAQAVEIGGATVNGEVAFDYQSLSAGAGQNNTGFINGAENEAYALRDTTLTFSKDGDVFFNGRFTGRKVDADTVAATGNGVKSYAAQFDSLEVGYKVMPNLSLSFGRMLTTLGYEAIDRNANAQYTYSLAYNNVVPGFYEGVRAKYTSDIATVTVSSYNNASKNGSMYDKAPSNKATEISATGSVAGVTWFAGHVNGTDANKEALTTSSLWASYGLDNMKFALTFDGTTKKVGSAKTEFGQVTGAHFTYGMGKHNLGLRYEMMYGAKFLTTQNTKEVSSVVLGDKFAVNDNMKLYAEYRMDQGKDKVYTDKDAKAQKSASSFTIGAVAHF